MRLAHGDVTYAETRYLPQVQQRRLTADKSLEELTLLRLTRTQLYAHARRMRTRDECSWTANVDCLDLSRLPSFPIIFASRPARDGIPHPPMIDCEQRCVDKQIRYKARRGGPWPSFGFVTARPLPPFLLLAIRDRSQTIDFYFLLVARCPTPPPLLSSVDRA